MSVTALIMPTLGLSMRSSASCLRMSSSLGMCVITEIGGRDGSSDETTTCRLVKLARSKLNVWFYRLLAEDAEDGVASWTASATSIKHHPYILLDNLCEVVIYENHVALFWELRRRRIVLIWTKYSFAANSVK